LSYDVDKRRWRRDKWHPVHHARAANPRALAAASRRTGACGGRTARWKGSTVSAAAYEGARNATTISAHHRREAGRRRPKIRAHNGSSRTEKKMLLAVSLLSSIAQSRIGQWVRAAAMSAQRLARD
jgi:hypothetical protein